MKPPGTGISYINHLKGVDRCVALKMEPRAALFMYEFEPVGRISQMTSRNVSCTHQQRKRTVSNWHLNRGHVTLLKFP